MATEQEIQSAVSKALDKQDTERALASAALLGLMAGVLFPPIGIATVLTAVAVPMIKGTKEGMKIREENPNATPEEIKALTKKALQH